MDQYKAGEIVDAEKTLHMILNFETSLNEQQLVSAYNNLGVVSQMLGKYDEALKFYNQAEFLVSDKIKYLKNLADIYSNKGIIFSIKKSFDLAVGHFEKSIRVYNRLDLSDMNILSSLASTYLNTGIAFLANNYFNEALGYFNKSLCIKEKYKLSGIELVYLNIAKVYAGSGDTDKAERFYQLSVEKFITGFNETHYRLAEVYFDYGLFLDSEKRYDEALSAHERALAICKYNYGKKHPLVALSNKHLGDHYFNRADYRPALDYYQQSLISVVADFNDPDINSNPSIDSVIFDIRLLDNLKSKAKALDLLAFEQDDNEIKLQTVRKSMETIELALKLITRIRNNYLTEESRLYLSENEKETSIFAINIAGDLYSLTGDKSMIEKMYNIVRNEKSAVLRNEIRENAFYYSVNIPDSLREQRSYIASNIGAYNKMVLDESLKIVPDSNKISLWKDAIFEMSRSMEKMNASINNSYPQYNELLHKTEPLPLSLIRKNLQKDETIVDYILSNRYTGGQRDLYIFVVTRENLNYIKLKPDTCFSEHAMILNNYNQGYFAGSYTDQTGALNYMYNNLIKPAEEFFAGKKLIIIPDDEIGQLPFDAFLVEKPGQSQRDYDGLGFLINDYTISYCYSTSMLIRSGARLNKSRAVYAFSPAYNDPTMSGGSIDGLPGAAREIESIFRIFSGREFSGPEASETNFRKVLNETVIFHLAMHLISDSVNSKYSYLLFDRQADTISDGKLYNYEVNVSGIRSPLVVLSSCNSGQGTLYHGEGLMSLARGFTLAGASSVVRTAWEVNDETSSKIISLFYHYLSKGKYKDEAMRLAKLDYLRETPPAFSGPYFWAAYEVMGDNSPVVSKPGILIMIIAVIAITALVVMFFYCRDRRIFAERSE